MVAGAPAAAVGTTGGAVFALALALVAASELAAAAGPCMEVSADGAGAAGGGALHAKVRRKKGPDRIFSRASIAARPLPLAPRIELNAWSG